METLAIVFWAILFYGVGSSGGALAATLLEDKRRKKAAREWNKRQEEEHRKWHEAHPDYIEKYFTYRAVWDEEHRYFRMTAEEHLVDEAKV